MFEVTSMKRAFAVGLVIAASVVGFEAPSASAQEPTSAELTATYSGETGLMTVVQTLDRSPRRLTRGTCSMRVRATVYYEGVNQLEADRTVFVRNIREKVTRVRFPRLPEIRRTEDAERAVVTFQTRTTCRRGGLEVANVVSNADATYVACGRGTRAVTPRVFVRELSVRAE